MAVSSDHTVIHQIKTRLATSRLPGESAHARMSIRHRVPNFNHKEQPKEASVLLLLNPGLQGWEVVYTKRAEYTGDRHKGQISFPGGQREATDHDALATALRETEEEIGAPAQGIIALGRLTSLYIPVSNFQVQPFVGYLKEPTAFNPDPREIDRILLIPLDYLRHSNIVKQTSITVSGQYTLDDVPYFDLYGEVLWGATAMITAEFLDVIREQ